MKPAPVAVAPPVPEKIEYNPVFDPVTFGQMERGRADTIQHRFQPKQVAVAQPQPFRQPTPQEARVNRLDPQQAIFTSPYSGSQLPRNMPEIASPTPEDKAEGYFEDEQIPVLAQQGNKSGNVAVTQSQPKGKNLTEEQMKRLMENSLDRFMDTEAKQSGAVQGA
jgi:hypothetical protein